MERMAVKDLRVKLEVKASKANRVNPELTEVREFRASTEVRDHAANRVNPE
jgi:hypothetical protein